MYIGMLYIRLGGVHYYSPTFPRGGLSALFGVEAFALNGTSPSLDVIVQHKNEEDTTFTTAGTFTSITAAGLATLDVSGLKEQVRLDITVGGASNTNMVYANVLAPQWRPY